MPQGRPFWAQKSGGKIAKIDLKNPDLLSFNEISIFIPFIIDGTNQITKSRLNQISPTLRCISNRWKHTQSSGKDYIFSKNWSKNPDYDPIWWHVLVHLSRRVPPWLLRAIPLGVLFLLVYIASSASTDWPTHLNYAYGIFFEVSQDNLMKHNQEMKMYQ